MCIIIVLNIIEIISVSAVGKEVLIVAYTPITAQSGTDVVQKINTDFSYIISGGAKLTGFHIPDNATGVYAYDTISSANAYKSAYGHQIPIKMAEDTISWTAATSQFYIKIYYKGYGKI